MMRRGAAAAAVMLGLAASAVAHGEVGAAGAGQGRDWPQQLAGPTHLASTHAGLPPQRASRLGPAWQQTLAPPLLSYGSGEDPTVVKDTVYTAYAALDAYDARTGEIRWRRPLPAPALEAPSYADGRLVVISTPVPTDGNIHPPSPIMAFDARSGALLWKRQLPRLSFTPPVVADARIFTIDDSNHLRALRLSTGAQIWQTSIPNPSTLEVGDGITFSAPSVADGRVIVHSDSCKVVSAYDEQTGRRLWLARFASQIGFTGASCTAALLGDTAYVGNPSGVGPGEVVALDAASGRVRWAKTIVPSDEPGAGIISWLVVTRRDVVAAHEAFSTDQSRFTLADLNADTGALRWQRKFPRLAPDYLEPVVAYAAADGVLYTELYQGPLGLYRLRDGGLIRRIETPGSIAGLSVANGRVYAAANYGGTLVAYTSKRRS